MFCVAASYKTIPENLDEVVHIFQESVPMASRQTGFRSLCLMTKRAGDFLVVTLWDTEPQAISWPLNPEHQKIISQLRPLLVDDPGIDGYEVPVHVFV